MKRVIDNQQYFIQTFRYNINKMIMKSLTYIFFVLFSIITSSQEKKVTPKIKDIDKKVNISLDSLSKIY